MNENKGKQLSQNFWESEFECKCGCGFKEINPLHVHRLQIARKIYGKSIHINSACRCKIHNKAEGGVDNSSHVTALATDLLCSTDRNRFFLSKALNKAGFKRIGKHGLFIHVDSDLTKKQNVEWIYKSQPDSNHKEKGNT